MYSGRYELMIEVYSYSNQSEQTVGSGFFLSENQFLDLAMPEHRGRNVTVNRSGLAERERWP